MPSPRHEFELIDWIRRKSGASRNPRLKLGIGDDAAVIRFPEPADCLITVDMLMEGTDFLLSEASPQRIGHKSLAVNLSDIAAMAGRPVAAVVSVALPRTGGWELGQGLHDGLQSLATRFGVAIAGGDTNTWDGPLVISITVLGETTGSGAVTRGGAKAGDWIMATGSFGGSLAGKHLDFTPRVSEALALHAAVGLHAMIDVSDGLAADLWHLLEESQVGAVLDADAIPLSDSARQASDGRTPLDHALSDGEDFELLFTVTPDDGTTLLADPPITTPLSRIGTIVAEGGCMLRGHDGQFKPLPPSGWKHGFVP